MLRVDGRALSLPEALSSLLQGEVIPAEESSKPALTRPPRPAARPKSQSRATWLAEVLQERGGVVAAIPATAGAEGTTVALDELTAGGNSGFWVARLLKEKGLFEPGKPRCSAGRLVYQAVLLNRDFPSFFCDGDMFGLAIDATDALVDAGVSLTVVPRPYAAAGDKQVACCATELALHLVAAERGIAPAVFAAFFVDADSAKAYAGYTRAAQPVRSDAPVGNAAQPAAMAVVSQLQTFTLADLMEELRTEAMPARREHLRGVLEGACGDVFRCVKRLGRCEDGFAIVKLGLKPESVVFCPELQAGEEGWVLSGHGYNPIGDEFVDGRPRITDFATPFTFSVREASHSPDAAFLLHTLLLAAFTRAEYGAAVAGVLLDHLTQPGDPAGFVAAARALEARSTNVSAFLAALAANGNMREQPDVSKALSGVVSDLASIARTRVVGSDGALAGDPEAAPFNKLVCMLCGSSHADTRIFARDAAAEDDVETEHLRSLAQLQRESVHAVCARA